MNANCALQVVGAGPAGMSLVLALCNRVAAAGHAAAVENRLLQSLQIFEARPKAGGKMASYQVNANTSAHDVVRGIDDATPFASLRDRYLQHPETQSELIPLGEIGRLMVEPLAQGMQDYLGERLHCNVEVARVEILPDGLQSYDGAGNELARSESMLLSCGAREVPLPELAGLEGRWEGSGNFLLRDNLEGLEADDRPIVIVGASHSAFSCAWRLLFDPLFSEFARARDIVILHRRERIKLRCTAEFAADHGIEYDPVEDVCPVSGLVFRNGGMRKDAKALYLDIRDGRETRVRLQQMDKLDDQSKLLEQASLVLQATGFQSRLPLIERDGQVLDIGQPTTTGELRDANDGCILPGLFGMGLGLNILPAHAAGEPSFRGGIHGFQSYPITIAPGIIDCLVARAAMEECH